MAEKISREYNIQVIALLLPIRYEKYAVSLSSDSGHQVSQDGRVQVHPGAVAEEAVGHDALPAEGPLPPGPTKRGGWDTRPSKVMSYTGFASAVVAANARCPRVRPTASQSIMV